MKELVNNKKFLNALEQMNQVLNKQWYEYFLRDSGGDLYIEIQEKKAFEFTTITEFKDGRDN